jgi:DNA-directed RNA polymerase specialized sigma24 family protein
MNKDSQPDQDRDDRNLRAIRAAQASSDQEALRTALGRLLSPYWAFARSVAYARLSGAADRAGTADVIAQEVAAKLAELVLKEPEVGDAPIHILARIWIRIFLQRHWRGVERHQKKILRVADMTPESAAMVGEDEQSLRRQAMEFAPYIAGLSDGDREVLTERMFLGLTPEQSAARRGISREALDTRYSRALARARAQRRKLDVRDPDEGAA